MLTLSFTFPGGSYHATPWDRHVNEGAVAWPPEPWRILRTLVATWHHKVKWTNKHNEATLAKLVETLAGELPRYTLPRASHGHTRHYMPQSAVGKTSLVFDAFAAVAADQPLTVTWPTVDLPHDQSALLDDLLAVLGYLGRAESWVEARRLDQPRSGAAMVPYTAAPDTGPGEVVGEAVTLFAPLSGTAYEELRRRFLTDRKAIKRLGSTLPAGLLKALCVETADLRKQGWSQPPAARKVTYVRPLDALRPVHVSQRVSQAPATTARYLLVGKPLPCVEDTVRVGENFRQAVMSEAKRQLGPGALPAILSGHGLPAGNRHRHAFYLPWDANDDGRIDRLLLHVPQGMNDAERAIAARLERLWNRDGGEWRVVLEGIGETGVGDPLTASATVWQSVTPYLHPWHIKRRLDVREQICRECRVRALPEPEVLQPLAQVAVGSRARRPIHFHRFRSKRGLEQPDRRGSFWRLRFPLPVSGPLALGFGCHFGLGLFMPLDAQG